MILGRFGVLSGEIGLFWVVLVWFGWSEVGFEVGLWLVCGWFGYKVGVLCKKWVKSG